MIASASPLSFDESSIAAVPGREELLALGMSTTNAVVLIDEGRKLSWADHASAMKKDRKFHRSETDCSTASEMTESSAESVQNEEEEATSLMQLPLRPIIKRSSLTEESIYINSDELCWKKLPPPDLRALRASLKSNAGEASSNSSLQSRKSVSFGTTQVRKYDQIVGDNPCVTEGPPVQLDWEYEEGTPVAVSVFESMRGPTRELSDMILSLDYRMTVPAYEHDVPAYEHDVPADEVEMAGRAAAKAKRERENRSVLTLPLRKLDGVLRRTVQRRKRRLADKINRSS